MSHFCTAVVLDTKDENEVLYLLDKALAPYQENNMEDCPEEYLEFESRMDDIEEEYNTLSEEDKKETTIKQFALDEGYQWDDETDTGGWYVNPNAKWDWWVLCSKDEFGRFKNSNYPKGYCKVKDYKRTINEKTYNEAIRFWEIVVEGKEELKKDNDVFISYKPEYYIKRYGTKEKFAELQATPSTYAIVYDGQWIEQGEMGWFGLDDSTLDSEEAYLKKFNEILDDPANQNKYIAFVDCHI